MIMKCSRKLAGVFLIVAMPPIDRAKQQDGNDQEAT
jgi:hypothetical protein